MHVRANNEQIAALIASKNVPHTTGPVLYAVGEIALRDAEDDSVTHEVRVTALAIPSASGWLKVLAADLHEADLETMCSKDCLRVLEIGG